MNDEINRPPDPEQLPIDEHLLQLGRSLFDSPEFRSYVDRALDDQVALFKRNRGSEPLSPEEEERFSEINDFVIRAIHLMDKYRKPETDE